MVRNSPGASTSESSAPVAPDAANVAGTQAAGMNNVLAAPKPKAKKTAPKNKPPALMLCDVSTAGARAGGA